MAPRLLVAALGFFLTFVGGAASAQSGGQPAFTAAEAAFARGERAFAQNAFAQAEAEFQSAYDLMAGHPNRPLILVNIARSIEQQGGREATVAARATSVGTPPFVS